MVRMFVLILQLKESLLSLKTSTSRALVTVKGKALLEPKFTHFQKTTVFTANGLKTGD